MSNEASPRPWLYMCGRDVNAVFAANGALVARVETAEDAALIVAAVNYYKPDLHCDWRELTPEEAVAHCREVAARLGDTPCARDHLQLAAWIEDRARLRDLVKRLITVREKVFWRKDEKTGMTYETCLMDEDEARKTIEEAKAAIKEDGE